MTTHEQALRALAQAYDREDAAQRGEPDPWNLDDPGDIGDSDTWVSERLACAQVAAEAFLSALLPEDVAGLVERLQERATVMEHLSPDFASVCREAATALRLSAGGGWRTMDSAPECDWTKGEKPTEALLYSQQFGVRTGQVGRFRDHLFGNVANLHGNAVADWGATHWMPLPASPTVEATP